MEEKMCNEEIRSEEETERYNIRISRHPLADKLKRLAGKADELGVILALAIGKGTVQDIANLLTYRSSESVKNVLGTLAKNKLVYVDEKGAYGLTEKGKSLAKAWLTVIESEILRED